MLSVYVEYKILLAWKVTATTTMKTTDLMFGSSILTAIQLFSALNIYNPNRILHEFPIHSAHFKWIAYGWISNLISHWHPVVWFANLGNPLGVIFYHFDQLSYSLEYGHKPFVWHVNTKRYRRMPSWSQYFDPSFASLPKFEKRKNIDAMR